MTTALQVNGSMLPTDNTAQPSVIETMEQMERRHVEAFATSKPRDDSRTGGAAEILGIDQSTLRSRMKKLGI